MSSVTFSTTVGGDGSTVTDDDNATTGLRNGGWRTRFIPALTQEVAVAANAVASATSALASKNSAASSSTEASSSASTAATQATNSANSATASASSATASASSATSAAASATSANNSVAAISTAFSSPTPIGNVVANTGAFTNLSYTGTLTGSTGILNIGSGQLYKDASGNVGIGTSSPGAPLDVLSNSSAIGVSIRGRSADGLSVYNFTSNNGATQYGYILGSLAELRLTQNGANYITAYTNGAERMRIDSSGNVGIGAAPTAGQALFVGKNITGATSALGIGITTTIQSDVTGQAALFGTYVLTQAATFTLPAIKHYNANQGAFGAGSTVNGQYGFSVEDSLTSATNNYGFYGSLAAATGRYNLYMAGTANNYLGGPLITAGLKATSAAAPTLASATTIAPTTQIAFVSGTTAIATITAPSPISLGGGQITLIPTGIFTTTTAGNIALASTAIVGKALIMTYDATTTKWYPSY